MSKSARATATELPEHDGMPARIVCAALALALITLAVRIAAIW